MINIICCMDQNKGIGYKNQLLCHLNADLQHFKKLTTNQFILMGRKTFDSLGKPLPLRHNIILSRNKKFQPVGTYVYSSLTEVISEYTSHNNNEDELFVIGGGEIFSQALSFAEKMYLTIIQHKFSKVDSYFPEFDLSEWDHKIVGFQEADDKNDYPCYFVEYTRKD